MSEWLVTCPECKTRFRVVAGQLAVADGRVRCGACLAVFHAGDRLEATTGSTDDSARPATTSASNRHRSILESEPSVPDTSETLPEFDLQPPAPAELELMPHEVPPAPARRRRPGLWLLTFGGAVLCVQLALWSFEAGALKPNLRPYYAAVCDWIGCALPELRMPQLIRSRRLSIRPHPEQPGSLLLEAMIENQADFPQPYPAIELQFADIRGRSVATRLLRPDEYLGGEVAVGSLMPVGQPVRIALAVTSPGEDAVNYQMAFR